MLRSSTGSWIASLCSLLAFAPLAPSSTSTHAQTTQAYPAIVHAYRNFDPGAVGRLRALTHDLIEDAVGEPTGRKLQPWHWADLRGAGMLHTRRMPISCVRCAIE
jgi:hypothetical protein